MASNAFKIVKNKIVTDKTFIENYSLMYVGRYSDDKSEELRSIAIGGKRAAKSKMAKNHTYKIKKMYTENTLGQYTTGRWRESLIIFSMITFKRFIRVCHVMNKS